MINDPNIRDHAYQYFLEEAPVLLETIEQELFALNQDSDREQRPLRVNELMRATHTLKGGAANVGLERIKSISHSLEDVFKALYNPELVVEPEVEALLFESYECLRLLLSAELTKANIDRDEVLNRADAILAQLESKLGNYMNNQEAFPSSEALGIDVVASFFEVVVPEGLEKISAALDKGPEEVSEALRAQMEVFTGLAQSLNLPGLGEIAQTTLAALDANLHSPLEIARAALADFQQAQTDVLAGDRDRGGEPVHLLSFVSAPNQSTSDGEAEQAVVQDDVQDDSLLLEELPDESEAREAQTLPSANPVSLATSLAQFCQFLDTDFAALDSKRLPNPTINQFYCRAVKCILGWFHLSKQVPAENLSLALLVQPNSAASAQERQQYLDNWLSEFWQFVDEQDSLNLRLYRRWTALATVLALARFLHQPSDRQQSQSTIKILQARIREIYSQYKSEPAIAKKDKNWLENPKFEPFIAAIESLVASSQAEPPDLLNDIWGKDSHSEQPSETAPGTTEEMSFEWSAIEVPETEPDAALASSDKVVPAPTASTAVTPTEIVTDDNLTPAASSPSKRFSKQTSSPKEESKAASVSKASQTVRVNLEKLEQLNYLVGELLIAQNKNSLHDEQIQATVQELIEKNERTEQVLSEVSDWLNDIIKATSYQHSTSATLSPVLASSFALGVDTLASTANPKLDATASLLELEQYREVAKHLKLALEGTGQSTKVAEKLKLLTKQSSQNLKKQQRMLFNMRDELIETRMSPLGNILSRFPRLIEQLTAARDKKINLELSGSHILVDKAIEEKLYDPLLHLVRNAFDHGIESPEVRRQHGKSETGRIEIHGYQQGGQTIIEVRDDGQGLNFERIKKRAIELNYVSESEANQMADSKLLELLFEPGFSTSSQVSDISGRGVGLDVVRTQVEALKGTIAIESIPQEGTTFSLQIPLTLTIAKLMVCQAGESVYALLLDSIEKILLPKSSQVKLFEGQKVLYWETETNSYTVPVRRLSDLMRYGRAVQAEPASDRQTNPILLLRRHNGLLGLEVDQILGEQELVIRPLGSAIAPPNYVYGCSVLSNSRLILVIDGIALVAAAQYGITYESQRSYLDHSAQSSVQSLPSKSQPQQELPPVSADSPRMLLVVDDSISLRQTLSMTLQKAGHQVLQASDGAEALQTLQDSEQIELVVCDLEMPNMNGFEVLKAVRKNPQLAGIPIIMLTTRADEPYRQLGLHLGAAAYLTKPFNEKEFLSTVASLLARKSQPKGLEAVR